MEQTTERPKIISNTSKETKLRVYEYLRLHPVGVLGTIDSNNHPHGSVIYFLPKQNFEILFTTKRDTTKHKNIKRNNRVTLVTFEAASQSAIQIFGEAQEVVDEVKANEAFRGTLRASMQTSTSGVAPISKLYAGQYVAYRIKPWRICLNTFLPPQEGFRPIYETIDFDC